MNYRLLMLLTLIVGLGSTAFSQGSSNSLVNTSKSPYAKLAGVGMSDVQWTDGFWAERFEICRQTMSPELLNTYMDEHVSHAFKNFEIAAGLDTGSHVGPPFHDGDFYKAFESLIAIYSMTGDKTVFKKMDEIIPIIAKSQRSDGYIHSLVMIEEQKVEKKEEAFGDRLNFETYNMGHLMTAGCLHYRVTGSKKLLNVAIKATDFLYNFYKTASPELARNAICPSHYMGVVEMYRTTNDKRYLELSKSLIDIRGLMEEGTDDNQDRVPFRGQKVAMGHAVRANYLYAGVADVYAETGDKTLLDPLNLIWDNMVNTKMYITGACGALYDGVSPNGTSYEPTDVQKTHQSYGRDYQLPNMTAHNETCANIGNLLWNWRMLQLTGEAKYADIVELTLYNSILSGVSLDGVDFCYTNPLAVSDNFPYTMRWSGGRIPYIALSNCCPPNTVRTISQVQNYMYNLSKDGLYVNMYGGSNLSTRLINGEEIKLKQTTDYPWDGRIKIDLEKAPKSEATIYLRIPGWSDSAIVTISGEKHQVNVGAGEYFPISRKWKKGDVIELDLPMRSKLMEANPLVEEVKNQIAVKRGPVVYCMESTDFGKNDIFQVVLSTDVDLKPTPMTVGNSQFYALEGVGALNTNSQWNNQLYKEVAPLKNNIPVKLIPYYAWGNRGKSDMSVWINLKR